MDTRTGEARQADASDSRRALRASAARELRVKDVFAQLLHRISGSARRECHRSFGAPFHTPRVPRNSHRSWTYRWAAVFPEQGRVVDSDGDAAMQGNHAPGFGPRDHFSGAQSVQQPQSVHAPYHPQVARALSFTPLAMYPSIACCTCDLQRPACTYSSKVCVVS